MRGQTNKKRIYKSMLLTLSFAAVLFLSSCGKRAAGAEETADAADMGRRPDKEALKGAQAGSYIALGAIEQDGDPLTEEEPVEWLVLENDGKTIFLISRYCLDAREYHERHEEVTWEGCSIRSWLNHRFFEDAFSEAEKEIIEKTRLVNAPNSVYGTPGGNETLDHVFLLSEEEAEKYLTEEERIAAPDDYALKQGVYMREEPATWWWLRSPGSSGKNELTYKRRPIYYAYAPSDEMAELHNAQAVLPDGSLKKEGVYVNVINGGIRPAIKVKID